jgi:hypothetical protein
MEKCILPFVSFTSMITSLSMTFESDAWSCKTGAKFSTVAAISVIAYLAINAVQHHAKLPMAARHSLNVVSIILPQLMLSIGEAFCKDRKPKSGADTTRLLMVWLVPVAIYGMGSSTASINAICKMLNVLGLSDATVKQMSDKAKEMSDKVGKRNALPYWSKFETPAQAQSPASEPMSPAPSAAGFTHYHKVRMLPKGRHNGAASERLRRIGQQQMFAGV